ncbi:MAG: PGPGW domain-containing protein [Thermoanaerobaculia bacterium]
MLRIVLHVLGWVVLAIGIAGLVLPGIQGILTIVVGAAILSLASDRVHRWLQELLKRWPRVGGRLDRLRQRLHAKLSRRRH